MSRGDAGPPSLTGPLQLCWPALPSTPPLQACPALTTACTGPAEPTHPLLEHLALDNALLGSALEQALGVLHTGKKNGQQAASAVGGVPSAASCCRPAAAAQPPLPRGDKVGGDRRRPASALPAQTIKSGRPAGAAMRLPSWWPAPAVGPCRRAAGPGMAAWHRC